MSYSIEHVKAARALRGLSHFARMELLWNSEQQDLCAEEQSKRHAAHQIRLADEEWAEFKQHCLDGGGSSDAHAILRNVLQALHDNDQATFWRELIHFLKGAGKHLGVITVQDGQVQTHGVGPTMPIPGQENKNVGD